MKVEKSIHVERPVQVAFKVFTEEIGSWWPPKEGFSFGGDRAGEIFLEGSAGGRLYERFNDGEEFVIGDVTAYEPPSLVAFTWNQPDWDGPTDIEVRFAEEGEGTLVELTHRGFERIGAKAEESVTEYGGGWELVLARYAAA